MSSRHIEMLNTSMLLFTIAETDATTDNNVDKRKRVASWGSHDSRKSYKTNLSDLDDSTTGTCSDSDSDSDVMGSETEANKAGDDDEMWGFFD